MSEAIVMMYLSGWVLTSVVSMWLLKTRVRSPRHPLSLSVLAGGAWLVLLVGAAQFGALLAIRKALAEVDAEFAVIASAADEFV